MATTARPRIAVASIMQESNTFNPVLTGYDAFESDYVWRGAEVTAQLGGTRVEMGGVLATLAAAGAKAVPLLAAHACSGGPLESDALARLRTELLERCAAAGAIDGVLLVLHGAMASEDEPDAEGALLEAVRSSFPGIPIAASLDLHAHVTPRMVEHADLLVGYRNYPHTDMFETGERVAQLLLDTLAGRIRPRMALEKLPMLVSPVSARTERPPLDGIVALARQLEQRDGILAASLFPVQPWLDLPGLGFAALVVADGDAELARAAARTLTDAAWDRRGDFDPDLVPLERALAIARVRSGGPVVIGDAGDAQACGATGDEPTVLRALLSGGFDGHGAPVLLTLCDPPAAAAAAALGIGGRLSTRVGHALSRVKGDRVRIEGTVVALRDTPFALEGPGAHGMPLNAGQMAVIEIGDIRLVLTSIPAIEWDPAPYRAVGLRPEEAGIVFVKSPTSFRAGYQHLAHEIVIADTPGGSRCDMRRLELRRVGYPLYPIQEDAHHAPS